MRDVNNNFEIKRISKYNHIFLVNSNEVDTKVKKPALFFDRDGVIIEDYNYISNSSEVRLLPGVKELLNLSRNLGWINIVVTNQSGIFRGYFGWSDYENVTLKMIKLLGNPININAVYANGCGPSKFLSKDSWRKPNPNMILHATSRFNIDLKNSILIGDRLTDLMSAYNSGIITSVHVLTGHGSKERNKVVSKFKKSSNKTNLILIDDLTSFPFESLL